MWRFKPFMGKEQVGLEGRTIDIGNLKVNIKNAIAEGGFSCVYLARDVIHSSKQYALKHMICNDDESLEIVMKEIAVMKSLKGHPNVVTLQAHTILDMGRTKEALLVMEFCEKSLVSVLESRGAGYFEEKQALLIFRDVCNAVFAMHCQSPPIAHRDLKAENLLLGPDGSWKLCDFGSTSTNHKRFERPEEMGIEEDNIRKHTTPAYRAPEMWDLFRRELINEKVDIWALGCLLFRICYFKSAFDGESKLQILNGNYRIPELPKYSSSLTGLIKDLLQSSPDDRPDITQVWFRVNDQLPAELQKSLPDRPVDMRASTSDFHDEARKSPPMPRRSPPPPPSSKEPVRNVAPQSGSGGAGAPLGAFWSTQHAKGSVVAEERGGPVFDKEPSPPKEQHNRSRSLRAPPQGNNDLRKSDNGSPQDFEIRFFSDDADRGSGKTKTSQTSQNETFNTFVADFDNAKLDLGSHDKKTTNEEALKAEVDKLKEQLKQSNLEKAEITSKFEKLSAICRSQRQEIQELKQAVAAKTPSPNRDASKHQSPFGSNQPVTPPQIEKKEGIWELQEGMFADSNRSTDSKQWHGSPIETKSQPSPNSSIKSVRTTSGRHNRQTASPAFASSSTESWGFGTDNFTAIPTSSQISKTSTQGGNTSQRFNDSRNVESKKVSQPAGWAGF